MKTIILGKESILTTRLKENLKKIIFFLEDQMIFSMAKK